MIITYRQTSEDNSTVEETAITAPNIFDFSMLINHQNLALVQKSAEFECAGIKHENVISYENVTLDKVHGSFAYIAGK